MKFSFTNFSSTDGRRGYLVQIGKSVFMLPIHKPSHSWSTNFKVVIPDVVGAILFFFLFIARAYQALRGNPAVWFLAVQSGVAAILFVFRKRADRSSSWSLRAIVWLSAFIPLRMTISTVPYLSIPGLLLSIWALAALGRSFSISPADRGIVKCGPYRFLRHPMYAGELLSLFGLCIVSGSIWNWMILTAFSLVVYIRIIGEEIVLTNYQQYKNETKWRLIPGVW